MRNRFNINESEKKRIRAMHNISEQTLPKLPEGCEDCLKAAIGEKYKKKANTIIIAVNEFMSKGKTPTLEQIYAILKDVDMMDALSIATNLLECKMCVQTTPMMEEEDLGGMTSDPRIMSREYGETPESPESKAAEQIFQLFDHKIGEWTISPDHRVTQETQQYLNDWKEDAKSQLEVIINTVMSEYQEQDIDDELDALQ